MRYCEAEDEVKKNPDAKRWIATICNGNTDAEAMLWGWWNFFHMFDDMIDQDKPTPKELVMRECFLFIRDLSFNPFYLEHKVSLFTMLMQVLNRWLDGDEWEKSDDEWKRSVSDVLRCGDMELYFHVAYLCGGWDHMRACKGVRCYDRNQLEEK